jgi:hypothetical protein
VLRNLRAESRDSCFVIRDADSGTENWGSFDGVIRVWVEDFYGFGPSPRGVLRKSVIPGELLARDAQEFDFKRVSGIDFSCWLGRRAYRSSSLGKRWRDLVASDGRFSWGEGDHCRKMLP